MAKLWFRYTAMNGGKSSEIVQVAYNYESQGDLAIIMKSSLDTKSNKVSSRSGLSKEVDFILGEAENPIKLIKKYKANEIGCILVEEAQFLTESQVEELWWITKRLDIPVIAYGLKNDFQTRLFVGSKRLIELADEIQELTLNPIFKRRKARFNARRINGEFVFEGDQVAIDEEEKNKLEGNKKKAEVTYASLDADNYIKEVLKEDIKTFKLLRKK